MDDGGVGPWPARPNDPAASVPCRLVCRLWRGLMSLGNRSGASHSRWPPRFVKEWKRGRGEDCLLTWSEQTAAAYDQASTDAHTNELSTRAGEKDVHERVNCCGSGGFGSLPVRGAGRGAGRGNTARVFGYFPSLQGLFRFTKRAHTARIFFKPNTSRYRVGGRVSGLGEPPTHGGFFMPGFSEAVPALSRPRTVAPAQDSPVRHDA